MLVHLNIVEFEEICRGVCVGRQSIVRLSVSIKKMCACFENFKKTRQRSKVFSLVGLCNLVEKVKV